MKVKRVAFLMPLLWLASCTLTERSPELSSLSDGTKSGLDDSPVCIREIQARVETAAVKSILQPVSGKTQWEPGDSILVDNGKDRAVFVYNLARDRFVTERSDFAQASSYTALFPARWVQDGVLAVPQTLALAGACCRDIPLSGATESDGVLLMRHTGAVLYASFPSDRIPAPSGARLDWAEAEAAGMKTYRYEAGTDGASADGILALWLPARTYSGGLTLRLGFSGSEPVLFSCAGPLTLSAGEIALESLAAASGNFSGGSGTTDDPYRISCVADFLQWKAKMTAGSAYASAQYRLTDDIDLTDVRHLTPMDATFTGGLDGDGHTLKGLCFTSDEGPAGLFRQTDGAVIKHLSLVDVQAEGRDFYLGALVGRAAGTTFENCSVSGAVHSWTKQVWDDWSDAQISLEADYFGIAGGLVGRASACQFKNCAVQAKVMSAGKCVGGIVGLAGDGTVLDACRAETQADIYTGHHGVGGLTGGLVGAAQVKNSVVEGRVAAFGGWAGGVTGYFRAGTIENCVVGSHTRVGQNRMYGGGIAGAMEPKSGDSALINRVTVYADVDGQCCVGGVTGAIDGAGTAVIRNAAYLSGTVTATGTHSSNHSMAGGFVGWVKSGSKLSVCNCVSRPKAVRTFLQNKDVGNAGVVCDGGSAGLLGYVSGSCSVSNSYTTLSLNQLTHRYQPVTAFSDYLYYGSVYGRATASVSLSQVYYDADLQLGVGSSTGDAQGLTVQQMTDSSLLSSLNTNRGDDDRWRADASGYPVLNTVQADPHPAPAGCKRVSVIGDSISTFVGFIPASYHAHYPATDGSLVNVSDTYWYRLIYHKMKNAILDENIACSGTTVARTTKKNGSHLDENSFCERYIRVGGMGNPDIVLIHGGTNDRGRSDYSLFPGSDPCNSTTLHPAASDLAPLFATADAAQTRSDIEALDDQTFCTAYIKLVRLIQQQYPGVKIVSIIGDYITEGIVEATQMIAAHYGLKTVNLYAVNGFNGITTDPWWNPMPKHDYNGSTGCHPGVQAMHFIADKIYDELGPWLEN